VISQIWEATTAKTNEDMDRNCQRQNCNPLNVLLADL